MQVLLKPAKARPLKSDGSRVFVERTWPRGLDKEAARLTAWLRELAPTDELRVWFQERPTQWPAFRRNYLEELCDPAANHALEDLYAIAEAQPTLTLVFAAKDARHNHAVVLKELLEGARKPPASSGPAKAAATAKKAKARR